MANVTVVVKDSQRYVLSMDIIIALNAGRMWRVIRIKYSHSPHRICLKSTWYYIHYSILRTHPSACLPILVFFAGTEKVVSR